MTPPPRPGLSERDAALLALAQHAALQQSTEIVLDDKMIVDLTAGADGLRVDDGQQLDADRLREALSQPRVQAWSQVTIGPGERFDGLHLWLALALPGFCRLTAQREAVDRGVVAHAWPLGVPTVYAGGSFAYLGLRPVTPDRQWVELGAYAHGPDADTLAHRMIRRIQSWDRTSLNARIQAHPAGTPDDQLPEGLVLDKTHTRVVISWPLVQSYDCPAGHDHTDPVRQWARSLISTSVSSSPVRWSPN